MSLVTEWEKVSITIDGFNEIRFLPNVKYAHAIVFKDSRSQNLLEGPIPGIERIEQSESEESDSIE
jgi:hypothetical protein